MMIPQFIKALNLSVVSKKPKTSQQLPAQVQVNQQYLIQATDFGTPNLFPLHPSTQPNLQLQHVPADELLFKKTSIPKPTHKTSQLSYMFTKFEIEISDSRDTHAYRRKFWGVLGGHDAKTQYEFMLAHCEDAVSDTEAENWGWIEGDMAEGLEYTKSKASKKVRMLKERLRV